MHKFEHKQLVDKVLEIDQMPEDEKNYSEWLKAKAHLQLILENASDDEIIIYANGPFSFIHSVVVPIDRVLPVDVDDLHNWSCNPYSPRSSYVTEGGHENLHVEHGFGSFDSSILKGANQLVFARTFEGWTGSDKNYFEVLQEFSHLAGIHWRPEYGAFCRLDEEGNVNQIVSVTQHTNKSENITLVSFCRKALDEYLAASKLALIRLFDLTLVKFDDFAGYGEGAEVVCGNGQQFSYRHKILPGHASYTRGYQVLRPRLGDEKTTQLIKDEWYGKSLHEFVEFVAYDWRNKRVTQISTNPTATTNYFVAQENNLPYELSPAFFKPEVLLKYKADRDKYTIGTRTIRCRGAWSLKGYDVNVAGQIHAYICDLRGLPYAEQLHWLSHNERPRAPISSRAITCDFHGEFTEEIDPVDKLKSKLRQLQKETVLWWKITDERLYDYLTTPVTSSRDEWSEAFMDLSKIIIEGMGTKPIRKFLDGLSIKYKKEERSIKLLERLWVHSDPVVGGRFNTLRTIQYIRSKAKGHSGSTDAIKLSQEAIKEHGSHRDHFNDICIKVLAELEIIEGLFSN